jgi:hypothetical protein
MALFKFSVKPQPIDKLIFNMKPDTRNSLIRLSALESKLDTHLFAQPDDQDNPSSVGSTVGQVAGTAAGVGAIGVAGYGGYKGVQAVQNRLAQNAATVPGFLNKTKAAQIGGAVGSVLGDAGQSVADGAVSAWDTIKSKLAKSAATEMSSRVRLTELASKINCAERPYEEVNPPLMNGGKKEPYYPGIHISDRDEPIDLPGEGNAVVKYKISSRSMEERDGKQRHSAHIKIHSIEPQGPPVPAIERMGKALPEGNACSSGGSFSAKGGVVEFKDALSARSLQILFGDPRPRNTEGQFAPVSEGVPSPHAMAAAYRPGSIGKGLVNGAAAGVGAVAGIQGTRLAGRTLLRKIRGRI